jgi:hypothetical protein
MAAQAAVAIGGAIVGHNAQNKAAKTNEAAAKAAEVNTVNTLSARGRQEVDAAGKTIMQIDRETRTADAQARVSAGDAGVSGASVDALLGVIQGEGLDAKTTTQRNLASTLSQIEGEKKGAVALEQSRVAAVPRANPYLLGFQIAGAGVDYFAQRQRQKQINTPTTSGK